MVIQNYLKGIYSLRISNKIKEEGKLSYVAEGIPRVYLLGDIDGV